MFRAPVLFAAHAADSIAAVDDLRFMLERPIWPAIAGVAAVILTFILRRRRLVPDPNGQERSTPEPSAAPFLLLLGGACLFFYFTAGNSSFGTVLLLTSATAAIFAFSREVRRAAVSRGGLGRAPRSAAALRVLAWAVLLLVIADPVCNWRVTEMRRPTLAVLLDRSRSMEIADNGVGSQRRADLGNQALEAAQPEIARLRRYFDVRLFSVGDEPRALDDWRIAPEFTATALAAALRHVGRLLSTEGDAPAAVLLVGDGAENADEPGALLQAADDLARQHTKLLAAGVGPAPGRAPGVLIEPLDVPAQVGTRDRIELVAHARITGCAQVAVRLMVRWGDNVAHERTLRPDAPQFDSLERFDLRPPGPGLHRLTVRYELPASRGGQAYERSTLVDVRDDRIRVLYVERAPRSEFAFAGRALRGDPRFEVQQWIPARARDDAAPDWSAYNAVILGELDAKQLGPADLTRLARAVQDGGVGLLLAGGVEFFNGADFARSAMTEVSPVEFARRRNPGRFHPRFMPTIEGLRHPLLREVDPAGAENRTLPGRIWGELPALGPAARFGDNKPLAVTVATDQAGDPLLVAHDVGSGRCAAAAWESTWPWALASDEGLALHRRFWRQMAVWLANRRPRAWIVPDKPAYDRASVASNREAIRIRAGLAGVDLLDSSASWRPTAQLRLTTVSRSANAAPTQDGLTATDAVNAGQSWVLNLRRDGDEWTAELPRGLPTLDWLTAGRYQMSVEFHAVGDDANRANVGAEPVSATSGFDITDVDREFVRPTSNLALLQEAAQRTAAIGGRYVSIEALPELLRELLQTDPRKPVEVEQRYAPVRAMPGGLLTVLVALLTLEWMIRKRAGLT